MGEPCVAVNIHYILFLFELEFLFCANKTQQNVYANSYILGYGQHAVKRLFAEKNGLRKNELLLQLWPWFRYRR